MVKCRKVQNMMLGYHIDSLPGGWCASNQRLDTHCREEKLNWSRWERRAGSSRGWRGWWKAKDSCLDNIQCPDCWCSEDRPVQGGCQ